ncbi:MAG TPA: amino acid adenylation domain-containing protein, partial [Longimicrobiaceae bacterium]|nr:amino acid adenylation domain-containing protein [Longimicrobiaceae bacterium]
PTVPPSLAAAGEGGASARGVELPAELVDGLTRVARRAGATLKSVLLAAHLRVIGAAAGADDVAAGIVANGRPEGGDGERVLGLFLNTLPLRLRPGRGSWLELVRAAFDAERRMLPFRRFPVAELQRMNGGAPPFEVLFNFVHFHVMDRVAAEEGDRFVRARSTGTTSFPLAVTFAQGAGGGGIQLAVEYDTARFSDAQVERLLAGYLAVLGRMAEDPDARHDALDLLPPGERERVLVEWNATARGRPADTPVHELFAAAAARTPDAPAISFRGSTVTYAELERGAARLAHRLRALGVGPESRVGLCLERTPELVAAMLAVLGAGGCYVPLDPEYPAERVAYMLADSGATVLLTSEHLLGALPEFRGEIVVADNGKHDDAEDADALSHSRTFALSHSSSSLAYLIYTSGSTGTPKGVAVPHGALAAQIAWMQRAFPLTAADRVLQRTPFSFDASVWEFWAPLAAGATLVMAEPGEHREPARLARLMAAGRVTVAQFVPTLLGALLEEDLSACTAVRRVFAGGEALPAELAARARAAVGAEVVNLYGPTEVCINATSHVFGDGAGAAVPIGRPVDHVRAYVLDRGGEPVPVGVPGELYLGGVQVARGYLGRPGMTAGSFVPDGLSGEAGGRLYRTGDRVRWLPGGVLEFLGRADQQVKLRGFRIEAGEVEAVLRGHPGVADAVVAVGGDGAGERRLVAWLVASGGPAPDAAGLRGWMRARLPEHMVPSAFAALDTLPLTPGGKTDRRALPDPERASAGDTYVAPRTPTEERLAAAWADVLRAGRVGVRDSFFDLGGHSLLATQVVSRVRASFGVELLVADLFLNPTVESLARRVDGLLAAGAPADAPGTITRQARRGVARRTSPQ